MKMTFEFNLPEEREEMELALNGHKAVMALHDIDELFRHALKYSDLSEVESEIYQDLRGKVLGIIEEYGVRV